MHYKTAIGIIIGVLFVSLIIIFCIVIIKLYIKKIKEHNLKELEFQKTLNKTILETQEQVFENISQDLHDDIGQQLTFVNFQLEKIKLSSNDQHEDLNKLSTSVSRVSGSVRDLSHSLNSSLLMQNNLEKAIQGELERIKKYSSISVSFQSSLTDFKFSNTEKIILYRIFQETIANSLKHANASEITITMTQKPNFQLIICDNGNGFDFKNDKLKTSLGLSNLKSRCEMIQCDFHLTSKINEGTKIIIQRKVFPNE